jgi:hypothetical protein
MSADPTQQSRHATVGPQRGYIRGPKPYRNRTEAAPQQFKKSFALILAALPARLALMLVRSAVMALEG